MLNLENIPIEKTIENKFKKLPEEEKKEIDEIVEYFRSNFSFTQKEKLLNRLAELGSRALPHIREKLFTKNEIYSFARICEVSAQDQDLDFILESLKDEKILKRADRSAFERLKKILLIFIYNIRQEKNNDKNKLEKICDDLIELYATAPMDNQGSLAELIAATGAEAANEFLKEQNLGEFERRRCKDFLASIENVPSYELKRDSFYFENNRESNKEIDKDIGSDMGIDMDDYPNDFYFDNNLREKEMSPEVEKIINQVNYSIDNKEKLETTIKEVSKLTLFNSLMKNGNDGFKKSMSRIWKMHQEELAYSELEEIPTIGIEVECPIEFFDTEKVSVLDDLGINNCEEIAGDLWEVNPDFSYSPYSQARILQELIEFGAIPKTTDISGKASINKEHSYSLHVNFGMPADLNNLTLLREEKNDKMLSAFSDVATYAFVSPKRLYERKTSYSFLIWDDAIKSKKHKKNTDFMNEDVQNQPINENDKVWRFEYRANEFRDYTTFRMLAETQALAASLFAFLKKENGKKINKVEEELSKIWSGFFHQFKYICSEYNINESKLVDNDREKISKILESTNLQTECRKLINRFSRLALKAIKKEYQAKNEISDFKLSA